MNKEIRTDIVDEMTQHYCYICHKPFLHISNEPKVQIIGQVEWGKTLYVRILYSHIKCYLSKEVRRKQTTLHFQQIKMVMVVSIRKALKSLRKDYKDMKEPVWRGLTLSTIKQYSLWLKELSGR